MDAVAVVYTTPETQLQRLMKRNQLTLEQAQQRISSQLQSKKKQRADILFDNNGTKEKLVGQIENWLLLIAFFEYLCQFCYPEYIESEG